MKITKRLYAYPVLAADKDDYRKAIFSVEMSEHMELTDFVLHFSVQLTSESLIHMIGQGEAEYLIHIECSSTAFRKAYHFASPQFEVRIPLEKINHMVEIVAFVVTKKHISGFHSEEWVDDFSGLQFDLEKGSILAYQNLPNLSIAKSMHQSAAQPSLFYVRKRQDDGRQGMQLFLEGDKILISLLEPEYRLYQQFNNDTEMQPVLNAMLILPALVYMFEELDQEYEEDATDRHDYTGCAWYEALEQSYRSRGKDFEETLRDRNRTSFDKAQEVMEFPVAKALASLQTIRNDFGDDGEDDV